MSAVLVSLIAVAGTLLGSLSTYIFQRRTALRAEVVARNERRRQDRLVRILLLTDDATLRQRAVAVSEQIEVVRASADNAELVRHEAEFDTARDLFIAAARTTIAAVPNRGS